jgi:hypothetical protein
MERSRKWDVDIGPMRDKVAELQKQAARLEKDQERKAGSK